MTASLHQLIQRHLSTCSVSNAIARYRNTCQTPGYWATRVQMHAVRNHTSKVKSYWVLAAVTIRTLSPRSPAVLQALSKQPSTTVEETAPEKPMMAPGVNKSCREPAFPPLVENTSNQDLRCCRWKAIALALQSSVPVVLGHKRSTPAAVQRTPLHTLTKPRPLRRKRRPTQGSRRLHSPRPRWYATPTTLVLRRHARQKMTGATLRLSSAAKAEQTCGRCAYTASAKVVRASLKSSAAKPLTVARLYRHTRAVHPAKTAAEQAAEACKAVGGKVTGFRAFSSCGAGLTDRYTFTCCAD